jgi:hypothetical protein
MGSHVIYRLCLAIVLTRSERIYCCQKAIFQLKLSSSHRSFSFVSCRSLPGLFQAFSSKARITYCGTNPIRQSLGTRTPRNVRLLTSTTVKLSLFFLLFNENNTTTRKSPPRRASLSLLLTQQSQEPSSRSQWLLLSLPSLA